MGCENKKYARCVVALVFSVLLNIILSYALLYITNNVNNPFVIMIGWVGIGFLIGGILYSFIEGNGDNDG